MKLKKTILGLAVVAVAGVNAWLANDVMSAKNDLSLLNLENIAEAYEDYDLGEGAYVRITNNGGYVATKYNWKKWHTYIIQYNVRKCKKNSTYYKNSGSAGVNYYGGNYSGSVTCNSVWESTSSDDFIFAADGLSAEVCGAGTNDYCFGYNSLDEFARAQ